MFVDLCDMSFSPKFKTSDQFKIVSPSVPLKYPIKGTLVFIVHRHATAF